MKIVPKNLNVNGIRYRIKRLTQRRWNLQLQISNANSKIIVARSKLRPVETEIEELKLKLYSYYKAYGYPISRGHYDKRCLNIEWKKRKAREQKEDRSNVEKLA